MKNCIRLLCFFACYSITGIHAQNAPVSIAGTVVSLESVATVPLRATNFNNINSCNLMLSYDPSVAVVTGVTIGPSMGGAINTNLTTPGIIILGWYTTGGINLPDSSVMFNIAFSKVGDGITSISWVNDGYTCQFNNGSFIALNDTPTANYYIDGMLVFQSPEAPRTLIPDLSSVSGSTISVPVSITGFQMIGSLSLDLQYNPSVLSFQSFSNDSGYPGLMITNSQPGTIQAEAVIPPGGNAITLTDSSVLFTLNFSCLEGYSELNWYDNGSSCQYTGSMPVYPVLNDIPQSVYYKNGSVSVYTLPGNAGVISGPEAICAGTPGISYSIPVIANATGYSWSVPSGVVIVSGQNTNTILVNYSSSALSGNVAVFGTNMYGNGSPSLLAISVINQPGAAGIISGQHEICQGQSSVSFSVAPIENASIYNWSVSEGASITSGMNTNSILVSFSNTASSGVITVYGSNICGAGNTSDPFHVILNLPPEIINQPVDPPAVISGSGTALFTLQASGSGLLYKWQEFSFLWNDIYESGMYSGVATDTLRIINPSAEMNGYRYRCLVSGFCDSPVYSDGNATLSILTSVGEEENNIPFKIKASPNPFNDFISIDICLPAEGELSIELLNLLGETIQLKKGYYGNTAELNVKLNTTKLHSGIYTLNLKLKTGKKLMTSTQKLVCNH